MSSDRGRSGRCTGGELEELFFSTAARYARCLNISWWRCANYDSLGLAGSAYVPDYVLAEMDWLDSCERLELDQGRAFALYRLFLRWSGRHQGRPFPVSGHWKVILPYLRPDKAGLPSSAAVPSNGGAS